MLIWSTIWLQPAFCHREEGQNQWALELKPHSYLQRSHAHLDEITPQGTNTTSEQDEQTQHENMDPLRDGAEHDTSNKDGEQEQTNHDNAGSEKDTPEEAKADKQDTPGKGKKGESAREQAKPLICPCLEEGMVPLNKDLEGNVLIPASFYGLSSDEFFKRDTKYGTYCAAHDAGVAPDCDSKTDTHDKDAHNKAPRCTRRWCFVAADCACGEAATKVNGKMKLKDAWHIPMSSYRTDYFNAQEGQETNVWYSYSNCGEGQDWIGEHMSQHDKVFCGQGHSGNCEQEDQVCYRDEQEERYAGSQAEPGSTVIPWISIGIGLGAFLLLVLLGWLYEGLKPKEVVTVQPPAQSSD